MADKKKSIIPTIILSIISIIWIYPIVMILFNSLKVESEIDRKSTRLNSSHDRQSRMPSSA